jgi:hypothetical protein
LRLTAQELRLTRDGFAQQRVAAAFAGLGRVAQKLQTAERGG